MLRALQTDPRFLNWFYGFTPPETGAIGLGLRRVYIVPTRLGWMFAGTLAILLLGSINYSLALGFALTFLLGGLGLAGMVHTMRNLALLSVSPGRAEPVFAGEQAQFRLHLDNPSPFDRPSILARHLASGTQLVVDVDASSVTEVVLAVPAERRGRLALGRVMLETRFPLDLFRAWSYVEPEVHCIVYPRPISSPLPPPEADGSGTAARAHVQGNDDFSGLRAYQASDSTRHVAWKAVALAGDMLTKQFTDDAASEVWLDWRLTSPRLGTEERLSLIAGWVLAAERRAASYGLRLPAAEFAPGRGEAQRADCLNALALYDGP